MRRKKRFSTELENAAPGMITRAPRWPEAQRAARFIFDFGRAQ